MVWRGGGAYLMRGYLIDLSSIFSRGSYLIGGYLVGGGGYLPDSTVYTKMHSNNTSPSGLLMLLDHH